MIILGLTGSIGMGKSTVGTLFSRHGVPVHESDKAAHKALDYHSPVFEAIAKTFPESWNKKKNTLDRQILGELVFSDPEKKQLLENYIHPFVRYEQQKFIHAMRAKGIKKIVLDIPLLFETGAESRVDHTLVVTAPFFIQTQRILSRPNMTIERFNAILNAQMSDAEKQQRADFIVQTGQGLAFTHRQVFNVLQNIKERTK